MVILWRHIPHHTNGKQFQNLYRSLFHAAAYPNLTKELFPLYLSLAFTLNENYFKSYNFNGVWELRNCVYAAIGFSTSLSLSLSPCFSLEREQPKYYVCLVGLENSDLVAKLWLLFKSAEVQKWKCYWHRFGRFQLFGSCFLFWYETFPAHLFLHVFFIYLVGLTRHSVFSNN